MELFKNYLPSSVSTPSLEQCQKLSEDFKIRVNRRNNSQYLAAGETRRELLKDVSPSEEKEREADQSLSRFMEAADHLLFLADKLEGCFGVYKWKHPNGEVSLDDIRSLLVAIGAGPRKQPCRPGYAARGQPPKAWHIPGIWLADRLKSILRDLGYKGNVTVTDEDSIICHMGADVINSVYKLRIQAAGFATAMRSRTRGKRHFESYFPDAARIEEVE
jgi:hypothetical protein